MRASKIDFTIVTQHAVLNNYFSTSGSLNTPRVSIRRLESFILQGRRYIWCTSTRYPLYIIEYAPDTIPSTSQQEIFIYYPLQYLVLVGPIAGIHEFGVAKLFEVKIH